MFVTCRRRKELTDAVLLALVDVGWAVLDLHGCQNLKPKTILAALQPLSGLRQLDLTGCKLTNHSVYSLPACVPRLEELRLQGRCTLVDRAAWEALVPRAAVGSGSWEDEAEDAPAGCAAAHYIAKIPHTHVDLVA